VGLSGHDSGSFMGIRFNPYAAVPSMHVGWSFIVAWFGFRAARRRWLKAFFCVHPLLMALTVTGTGNHYFFDSASGLLVAAFSMALLSGFRGRRPPLRLVEPAQDEPVSPPIRRAA
jgi:O-antigen ligase